MRLKQWFFLGSLSPVAVVICLVGPGYPSGAEDTVPKASSEPKNVRKIPLDSIYSTSSQKGLKHIRKGDEEPYGQDLVAIGEDFQMGASNVLLVRGKDIATAAKATRLAFITSRSADVPVEPDDGSKGGGYWLVAYFGTAGSGTAWLVESAEHVGNTVRVTYRRGISENKDRYQYFAWVPLGGLEAGTYTLELFDTKTKEAVLLRRVAVAESRDK